MPDHHGSEKTKKRKRHGEEHSARKSKKPTIVTADQHDERPVRVSLRSNEEWGPIIASTPGVSVPSSVSFQTYTKMHRHGPRGTARAGATISTELLLQSSKHPKIDYLGREDEIVGGPDQLLKHYVGVYDPQTGKMEVVEARKMSIRATVRAQMATEDENMKMNMRERRNDLGQTFGTKKAKKTIASVTENAISPVKSRTLDKDAKPMKLDVAAHATLASIKEATAGMATRENMALISDASMPRPIANTDVEDIKDVYTIENLIGTEMMPHILVREWEQALLAKSEILTTSRFVSNRLVKVGTDVRRLKILRYMLGLLNLFDATKPKRGGRMLPSRQDLRKAMGNLPDTVVEGVKRKFSEAGSMSRFQSDLLITHLCALACLVDNYDVDMYDLKNDLKLENKEMTQYFKEIGARIVAMPKGQQEQLKLNNAAAAQHRIARLKLPLDFPKIKYGGRAK